MSNFPKFKSASFNSPCHCPGARTIHVSKIHKILYSLQFKISPNPRRGAKMLNLRKGREILRSNLSTFKRKLVVIVKFLEMRKRIPIVIGLYMFTVSHPLKRKADAIVVSMNIKNPWKLELDTGASVTVKAENMWRDQLGSVPLQESDVYDWGYNAYPQSYKRL